MLDGRDARPTPGARAPRSAELCQAHGYFSSGESFGVGDATEVWLLELIGKVRTDGALE